MDDGGKGKGPFAPSTDEDSESEKHDEDSENILGNTSDCGGAGEIEALEVW